MNGKLGMLVICLILGTALILPARNSAQSKSPETSPKGQPEKDRGRDLPEREEITQHHLLEAGAQIEISNIHGSVEVETVTSNTAQINVVRSAARREDLSQYRFVINGTSTSLVVRDALETQKADSSDQGSRIRERLKLRVPSQVSLKLSGIDGDVRIGNIEGQVQIHGVHGAVDIASAETVSEIRSVVGNVTATIMGIGKRGMTVNAIVGSVELRFAEGINADLNVHSATGGIFPRLPSLVTDGIFNPATLRGRIGDGGSPITISAVVGSVTLVSR